MVVEAEAYSNAPGLLKRGLAELLQHLLATFTTILQEQLPGETLLLSSSRTSRIGTYQRDSRCNAHILRSLMRACLPGC